MTQQLLGAHVSTAGGVPQAPPRAKAIAATAMQIFTKQANRWAERDCPDDECGAYAAALADTSVDRGATVSHDSYLINLASPDPVLRARSIDSFAAELRRYIVDLVRRTRGVPQVQLGCGPRASIALAGAAKALALFDGEEFVRPEHVHELAVPVLAHRMVLDPQAKFGGLTGAARVAEILREVPVPG